jgi:hypothetical protein
MSDPLPSLQLHDLLEGPSDPEPRSEGMMRGTVLVLAAVTVLGLLFQTEAIAQQAPQSPKALAPSVARTTTDVLGFQAGLEPRAIEILKAASARLAAAKAMTFTSVASYEGPSLLGPPLIYSIKSEVTLRRPNKLRVITVGDGPSSEFYYDGKVMMAFAPGENLVAVADAPATIDAMLATAYDGASIYFPFTDLIVADPYLDMADDLTTAFYIGSSEVVGSTRTDMVAFATKYVFAQIWIGTEDKLPRRLYAVYLNDPARLRHVLELSNWELNGQVSDDGFGTAKAATAAHIAFKRPDASAASTSVPAPPAVAR